MAGSDGYSTNITLNADGSVSFTNVPTGVGGLPSEDFIPADQFTYGYVEFCTDFVKAGTWGPNCEIGPFYILGIEVAVDRNMLTATQAAKFLETHSIQAAKGYTAYDYDGSPQPTALAVATSSAYASVLGYSSTSLSNPVVSKSIDKIQVAAGQNPDTGASLPALTANQQTIEKMYLAAFVRAPEHGGLDYWVSKLDSGETLTSVGNTVFSLPIVQAIYPASMSNDEFCKAIYKNVFGRAADADGLAYWSAKMTAGETRGDLVMDMIIAGQSTPIGTDGKAYIENRITAVQYAIQKQVEGGFSLPVQYLIDVSSKVTADNSSLDPYISSISASNGTHQENHFVDVVGVQWHPAAA